MKIMRGLTYCTYVNRYTCSNYWMYGRVIPFSVPFLLSVTHVVYNFSHLFTRRKDPYHERYLDHLDKSPERNGSSLLSLMLLSLPPIIHSLSCREATLPFIMPRPWTCLRWLSRLMHGELRRLAFSLVQPLIPPAESANALTPHLLFHSRYLNL